MNEQSQPGPLAKLLSLLGEKPVTPLPTVEPIRETVARLNPELLLNDIELRSDVHDWDGTPDTEQLEVSPAEAVAILDLQAALAAKRGNYGAHDDLLAVARLIEKMEARP